MKEKRRDSKGRILHTGESQRTDGKYLYKLYMSFSLSFYIFSNVRIAPFYQLFGHFVLVVNLTYQGLTSYIFPIKRG